MEGCLGILEASQGFAQRFGEVATDGHSLAYALHVRGQRGVGRGELLERESRHLDHDIVQSRLEAGRRLLGDVVRDLVQGVANRDLGGDLRDWETGRLGRQCR